MEYPGSSLVKPLRRTIFFAFVAVFFISTPLLILYTTGYRYDWTSGLIRETGGLSIDVLPENAKVILDGLPLDGKVPIRLKNIAPKKYRLSIQAAGYHTWKKEIEVYRKQTTYIKDIQLLKDAHPIQLSRANVSNLSLTKNNKTLIYTETKKGVDIILFDIKTHRTTTIASFSKLQPINYYFTDRHNYAAITVGSAPFASVFVFNLDNHKDLVDIAKNKRISKIQWRESNDPVLYYSTSSSLEGYYPKLRENREVTSANIDDWQFSDNSLWTVEKSTSTLIITKNRLGFNEVIQVNSSTVYEAINPEKFFIDNIYNDTVVLTDHANSLLIIKDNKQFLVNAKHTYLSPFSNWLLMWSDSELWTYATPDDRPYLLLRSGNVLKNVAPLDIYNTLAINLDGEIKALFPYEYIEQPLISENINEFVVDTDRRQIYFSNKQGLYSLIY